MKKSYEPTEFVDAAAVFANLVYDQELIERPRNERPFHVSNLEDDYSPSNAVRLLIDTNTSFFGHKEATFAGFVSWVIAPKQPELRREFIGQCIVELLAKAETIALDEFGIDHSPVIIDLIARHRIAGPQFLEQIYFPFGGMVGLAEYGSRLIMENAFDAEKRSFYTINKMMAACHYIADKLSRGHQVRPSINKSILIVRDFIDPQIASRASIYTRWSECRESIAWIYSSATIKLQDGTLLDVLLDGAATFDIHGHLFPEWAAKAKYFCDHVLKQMADDDVYNLNIVPITSFKHIPFECKLLTDKDMLVVNRNIGL